MKEQQIESPRVALGLDAASEGDVNGVRKFLQFVNSQMCLLGLTKFHPAVAARIKGIHVEVDRAVNFLDGFIEDR